MPWGPHHRGLGALIAEKFAAEGCQVAINYVSDLESANETAKRIEKALRTKTIVIQGVSLPDPNLYSFSKR
jgi:NAD(P)-dependent dehydrogenase (short-subunit alcohol dehydrogenase family)